MKYFFTFVLFISSSAWAATASHVPYCFGAGVAQGEYIIGVDSRIVSMQNLMYVLNEVDGRYLHANRYPTVTTNLIIILTKATADSSMTQDELWQKVQEILEPIAQIQGVTVQCNAPLTAM